MYESFFGLQQEPFSIAPDPRFLYMSDKHREALALLVYGLARGASFVLLTGEIGAGKTTVWRHFLEQLPPRFDVASVVNPKLDVVALLARICEDLRVELPTGGRTVDLIDALHGHLLLAHAQGRRTLIVIDEAQALSTEVLEQLRLLTNLDVNARQLQVMLIGQPELREMLARPQLEPLAQRVVARYHLPALSGAESAGYIAHRLAVAGLTGPLPFDAESLALIHRLCRGVPRRINVLCDRALGLAAAAGRTGVDRATVERAAAEVFGPAPGVAAAPAAPAREPSRRWAMAAVAVGAAGAIATGVLISHRLARTPVSPAAPVAARASDLAPPAAVGPGPATESAPAAPAVDIGSAFDLPAAEESSAWRALARRWGATLGAGDPCASATGKALICFRSRGGLASIRQLDRPAILRLIDERGHVAHLLLTGLAGDSATLDIAGVERVLPVAQLARWWRGEFGTFWRAPPGFRDGEPTGGELGGWLTQRLARVDGQGTAAATGEDSLRARILAFQVSQGLTPDGLAGPLTLMQLNRASGVDEPRLAATSGSRPS
jgi:general secretion pathway protein A